MHHTRTCNCFLHRLTSLSPFSPCCVCCSLSCAVEMREWVTVLERAHPALYTKLWEQIHLYVGSHPATPIVVLLFRLSDVSLSVCVVHCVVSAVCSRTCARFVRR